MAEQIETNIEATKEITIARVELFTEATRKPDDWSLRAYFETGVYDKDKNLLSTPEFGTHIVDRKFGDIKDVEVEAAGVKINIAQLAALIQIALYKFRKEDIDNYVSPVKEHDLESY